MAAAAAAAVAADSVDGVAAAGGIAAVAGPYLSLQACYLALWWAAERERECVVTQTQPVWGWTGEAWSSPRCMSLQGKRRAVTVRHVTERRDEASAGLIAAAGAASLLDASVRHSQQRVSA